MNSGLPKVLHRLGGRSLIRHVLTAARALEPDQLVVVVAPGMEQISSEMAPCQICIQSRALGTADAVKVALGSLARTTDDVLVLCGDTPFINPQTLRQALAVRRCDSQPQVVVVGMQLEQPGHYGRLLVEDQCQLAGIVEYADASLDQRRIGLCNSGVMIFDGPKLGYWLEQVDNHNARGEYYLTDVVARARTEGSRCQVFEAAPDEMMGVNTRSELARAEQIFQWRLREQALENGVSLIDPASVFFAWDVSLGRDCIIHPYVVLGKGVTIGEQVEIRSFCELEAVRVDSGSVIGPFARLRGDSYLAQNVDIGNFVELKHSQVGAGSKVRHLSYLGDTTTGENANIGAGTITCNYDGKAKHGTCIGEGALIGSNCSLVAPVHVGKGAILGAGSVITRDVEEDAMAVARARQRNLPGRAKYFRGTK